MVLHGRKELFFLACTGTLLCAVHGVLNLGDIEPFHERHIGLALAFFVLAAIMLVGASMARLSQVRT